MKEPLVSVVMPTLNCKEYISLTIDSVVNQTYQNWEFLIIDDYSTDGTREIITNYAKKDFRVRLIDGDKKGIGDALNKGCREARGKYIARIDADDICLPQRITEEVEFLENQHNIVLVNSDYIAIDEYGNELGRCFPCSSMRVIRKLLSRKINPIAHPTCMFRKDAYASTRGYLSIPSHEDLILWRSLIKYGDVGTIKHPLILHRMIGVTLSKKFIGNPYEKILNNLIDKIISDDGNISIDIEIYKNVMKQASALHVESRYKQKQSKGASLYNCFGKFLPSKMSQEIIIQIKNVYLYFKYSCWEQKNM